MLWFRGYQIFFSAYPIIVYYGSVACNTNDSNQNYSKRLISKILQYYF